MEIFKKGLVSLTTMVENDGFEPVGKFKLKGENLEIDYCLKYFNKKEIIQCWTVDNGIFGSIVYVGLTKQGIIGREKTMKGGFKGASKSGIIHYKYLKQWIESGFNIKIYQYETKQNENIANMRKIFKDSETVKLFV